MLPYLTNFPGIGGTIKQRPEDFFVQEISLYEPSGEGEHVYCEIQKIGLTTFDLVNHLSKSLRIPARDIGYAGLKDAQAITRQIFSIRGATEAAVMNLNAPEDARSSPQTFQILWARRHGNKLRLGHLAANRFAIKIRNVAPTDVVKLQPLLTELSQRGMPNYFGEQRFGRRGNNHLLGAALLRGDDKEVLRLLLGDPHEGDDPRQREARAAFDARDNERAMKIYPRGLGMERRILHRLMKSGKPSAAVRDIDEKLRRLWVSALQSHLFNQVLAKRIATLDKVLTGDLAWKHDSGAVFLVENSEVEQPRCDSFEISPSGPLVGYRMSLPSGKPLEIEQEIFAQANLKPEDFRVEGKHKVKGARRPLRVQPKDFQLSAGVDEFGPHITAAFNLPAGSFATVLLRELMKSE